MTTPDTKAIRAQMEPLDGFTPGPWRPHNQPGDWGLWGAHRIHVADASPYDWDQCIAQVEYQTPYCLGEKRSVIEAAKTAACNARLIAAAPDMRETILTLCDAWDDLRAENDAAAGLVEAARALGAMPDGYCFCSANRIGDDSKIHEPECADLRAALVAKENEQCQISIGPATGATINGLHGSGAGAPDAVDNSHTDAVARLVNALESGKSFAESWIEENGGIDGCDYQDRVSYENICAALAACKGVRDE